MPDLFNSVKEAADFDDQSFVASFSIEVRSFDDQSFLVQKTLIIKVYGQLPSMPQNFDHQSSGAVMSMKPGPNTLMIKVHVGEPYFDHQSIWVEPSRRRWVHDGHRLNPSVQEYANDPALSGVKFYVGCEMNG